MRFQLFLLAALATLVFAQSNDTDKVINALKEAGFTAFALLLDTAVGRFPFIAPIFAVLGAGNKTFFIPDVGAITDASSDLLSDGSLFFNTLQYHVAQGKWDDGTASFEVSPKNTIITSALSDNGTVQLPAGGAQALIVTKSVSDGSLHVLNQPKNVTITHTQIVDSLDFVLATVSGIFKIPENVSTTLTNMTSHKVTQFKASAEMAGLFGGIQGQRGVTLFAPTDDAFNAAGSKVSSASNADLVTIINNHVVNGVVLYSSAFGSDAKATSGQSIKFTSDNSGTNVTFGGSVMARVLQSDVLIENGVMHIIDTVDTNLSGANGALQAANPVSLLLLGVFTTMTFLFAL